MKKMNRHIIAAALLACGITAVAAEKPDPNILPLKSNEIFGFISLGKTTFKEYKEKLPKKLPGCSIVSETETPNVKETSPDCLSAYPGNPVIIVNSVEGGDVIENFFLSFEKSGGTFDKYLASLTRIYGKPSYVQDNKDDRYAHWKTGFGEISMIQSEISPLVTINLATRAFLDSVTQE